MQLVLIEYLNTSYVDIKLLKLKNLEILMLDLNTSYVDIKLKTTFNVGELVPLFKYILC